MTEPVTDPELLAQLNAPGPRPVTDPELLKQLEGGATATQSSSSLGWSDVPLEAVKNLGTSAIQFGKDLVQPILHPIDTAENIKNLGHGTLQKAGVLSGTEHVDKADAVGEFFKERYGGLDNLKKTMASDPVGFLGDLSMVLTGGGSAAARAPGMVGKIGQAVKKAGQVTDPINVGLYGAQKAGHLTAATVGNLGTHTGTLSVATGPEAGFKGGEAARAYRENIKGIEPTEETARAAQSAVKNLADDRGANYIRDMRALGADTTVLKFDRIDNAIQAVDQVNVYKGRDISPKTAAIREEIKAAVEEWRNYDPAEYHTVLGLDALKKKIGDIRDSVVEHRSPERVVADKMYSAVRQTIIDQAPKYKKTMEGYEKASGVIRELEKTLSLNPDATIDTALRKLQSVLRNNVNTSYGRRKELADYLIGANAPHLIERLAGQAMQPGFSRGLGRIGMQLALEIGAATVGHAALGPLGLATAAATLPFMSPHAVGKSGYYAGRIASPLKHFSPRTSYQLGRTTSVSADPTRANETKYDPMRAVLGYNGGGRIKRNG